jgi:hypothetical protein
MTTLSGILVTVEEQEKKKRLTPKIVAYLSLLSWSHALCSNQVFVDNKGFHRGFIWGLWLRLTNNIISLHIHSQGGFNDQNSNSTLNKVCMTPPLPPKYPPKDLLTIH